LTVTTVTADHDEACDNQAAALDRLIDSLAIESVAAGGLTSDRSSSRPAVPAERPSTCDPDICYGHWYAKHVDDATARCQPLIDVLVRGGRAHFPATRARHQPTI
jgi:hypothetical protein